MTNKREEYAGIDKFRIAAAIMIIAIHTSPLVSVSHEADFVLTRILARVAVPFFFMCTGYFLIPRCIESPENRKRISLKFLAKTGFLYGAAILIYLPVNIYSEYFKEKPIIPTLVKDLIFDGTIYHLWYIPASIIGFMIVYTVSTRISLKMVFTFSFILYLIGLFGDSYYGISEKFDVANSFYGVLFSYFDYTRNGLFFAPVFIVLGAIIAESKREYSITKNIVGFALSFTALIAEALILKHYSLQRHDSMYIMLVPTMIFLFRILLRIKGESQKTLRDISMLVYILHPLCIIFVRGFAKVLNLEAYLIGNSLIHFIVVTVVTIAVSVAIVYIWKRLASYKRQTQPKRSRAWAEIDLERLKHNVNQLKCLLPHECQLMAVVKSNAYGHGDIEISRFLNKAGISAFAVATLAEGIELRSNKIKGEVLILGYTHPHEAPLLVKYNLTQTVVDYQYAELLDSTGLKIKVHIKIDTGMHRLGETNDALSNLDRTYNCKNLIVGGTYTHLSTADSIEPSNILFTKEQIKKFYNTLNYLKSHNRNPSKIHIQSSYGILNYPELDCDYARVGIALYGVMSKENEKTKVRADLMPVLSLKARIVLTKEIEEGESVGYGRNFIAVKKTKIAVLCIGYADGIPRSLSCGKGYVLIKSKKAPIIGNICMDQLTVDISEIPDVQQGDIATLIGDDGNEAITAEQVASMAGTITNELLSRLGSRIERLYKKVA
ncbi:serine racemase VanT catalytic subunit [Clostridium sp. BNL1100]|uniref:serine racemase VanT catalytic subunit n=1 Tax=Clostridium sp. BNL1100 TaxID=755731 RepID=UPI00024A7CD7|nr:serine racemase VanT catalytic subunit [Clostridium sp. BNL1100]AEY66220.1 alanine racemase [Clostridium sp. BNL1100]